ncbi:hypothetical protein Tco_1138285 [Tanacetum coccineum]
MALSPSSFRKRYISSYATPSSLSSPPSLPTLTSRKRYQGTYKLIAYTETESDESEDKGTDSESEEAALEDQQQQAVSAEDTVEDKPLGFSYRAARRRALERDGDTMPNTYEVGQSSRSTPDQHITGKIPTQTYARFPVALHGRTQRTDTSITRVVLRVPSVSPVVPSPVATLPLTAALDEGGLLEIEAQLELHGSILHTHTHTECLDALPPSLFEGYGRDFTELFSRSATVREEILLQRARLRSLERIQEETEITMGTIWQPILALKTWAVYTDA